MVPARPGWERAVRSLVSRPNPGGKHHRNVPSASFSQDRSVSGSSRAARQDRLSPLGSRAARGCGARPRVLLLLRAVLLWSMASVDPGTLTAFLGQTTILLHAQKSWHPPVVEVTLGLGKQGPTKENTSDEEIYRV